MTGKELLFAFVVPLAIGAALFALAWRPRAPGRPNRRGWAGALALAGAMVTTYILIHGRPGLVPHEKWIWIVHLAALAGLLGVIDSLLMLRGWSRSIVGVGLAGAAGWALPVFDNPWAWRGAVAVCVLAYWSMLDPLAMRNRGLSLAAVLSATMLSAGVLIFCSGWLKLAQLAVAIGAAALPAISFEWRFGRGVLARGGTAVAAALLPFMLIMSWIYMTHNESASVSPIAFIALAAAPLLPWLGESAPLTGLSHGKVRVAETALFLAAIALSLGLGIYAIIRSP